MLAVLIAPAFAMSGPPQTDYVMVPTPEAMSSTFEMTAPFGEQLIRITAKQYEFDPSHFTVKLGVPVKLILTSVDVTHGFAIDYYNLNVRVEKGKDTIVIFTPDRAGTYDYYCSVFCGVGHIGMRGQMTVE